MKKVLIFGASGIVGNALYRFLGREERIACYGTVRERPKLFAGDENVLVLDVADSLESIEEAISRVSPQAVVNCVADTSKEPKDLARYFYLNAAFPQILAHLADRHRFQFIHLSTNGVFSGAKGGAYAEGDVPDARDPYGLSKILSERHGGTTIRTSLIGHSVEGDKGLLDWFLSSQGEVNGYTGVFWNGITTLTLAKIVGVVVREDLAFPKKILQIASERVSKAELLHLIKEVYGKDIAIVERDTPSLDQTLTPSEEQERYFDRFIKPMREQLVEFKMFYHDR